MMADYGIYERLDSIYTRCGGKIVVDLAFKIQSREIRRDFLIKSSQQDPIGDANGVAVNWDATSVRQLSEHGMRMIQGGFPRVKDKWRFEEFGERRVIMTLMVLLYNFQASTVGVNHILNSFMSRTEGFYSYDITETANQVFDNH